MKPVLYLLLAATLFASCFKPRPYTPELVDGYKAVFSTNPADTQINFMPARQMNVAGKIYVKDNYIYQLDQHRGIHVFDKTSSSQLIPVGFINVRGATEISISGNNLFTNSYTDLVVIDISDLQHIKLKSRTQQIFYQGQDYNNSLPIPPPEHNVYYECVTPGQGIIVGWEKARVYNNSCYYP